MPSLSKIKSSIYIHIPFCLSKCYYCDFCSIPIDNRILDPYVNALIKEITLRAEKDPFIHTIYLGGGTPSLLAVGQIDKILSAINNCFKVTKGCEITIEANPMSFDYSKALDFRKIGINRISIGIQSLNDKELKTLGRIHDKKLAIESFSIARKAHFENISVDIMYGIPEQDFNSWKETINEIVNLKPEHISTYELTISEGTVIYHLINDNQLKRLPEREIEKIYLFTINYLTNHGYKHYEISNFCLDGFYSRHNWNYWTRGKYIGFGLSAHSFDGQKRFYNYSDINNYISLLEKGALPVKDIEFIQEKDAINEQIFLGLRTNQGVDMELLKEKKGLLKELYDEGFIEFCDDRIRL
ncbi:MAG: radical SAM family heme chaperone HemW, partial [Thermodesulfovibrionales bacterium]|nr:radical SAM family heme chaperone HemW [Thermodesulfovibrionales bacterium]